MNKGFKNGKVAIDLDYILCKLIEDNGEFSRYKREQDLISKGKGSVVDLRKYDELSTRSNICATSIVALLRLNNQQQDNLYHVARLYGKRLVKIPEFMLSNKDKSNILDYVYNANQKQKYWSAQVMADYWKRKEA